MEPHSAEPFSLSILGSVPLEEMKFMPMLVLLGFRHVSALSLHHSRGTGGAGFSFARCKDDPEGCVGGVDHIKETARTIRAQVQEEMKLNMTRVHLDRTVSDFIVCNTFMSDVSCDKTKLKKQAERDWFVAGCEAVRSE